MPVKNRQIKKVRLASSARREERDQPAAKRAMTQSTTMQPVAAKCAWHCGSRKSPSAAAGDTVKATIAAETEKKLTEMVNRIFA